jgi:deoxyribodipyrimidine photo-lyase
MYDLQDLPYEPGLENLPNTFTPFRNKVEKSCKIRAPLPISKGLGTFPGDSSIAAIVEKYSAELPNLQDLGYTSEQIEHANFEDPRGVMSFKGGETAALERVKDYIWDKDLLRKYFDTRNGMIGADYSTKVGIPVV